MAPHIYTVGYRALANVYFPTCELLEKISCSREDRSSIKRALQKLSDAGSVLAREGTPGIEPCHLAFTELQELLVARGVAVPPELSTAFNNALSLFAKQVQVLEPTGVVPREKFMNEGWATYWGSRLPELLEDK